jgi:hypothetical protein
MHANELHASAVLYARLREELATAYGLEADDEVLEDTLEGATDLKEVIIRAIREAKRAEAMAEAMGEIIKANQERKARHTRSGEAIRAAVAKAMQDAGLSKITAPDMTISQSWRKSAPNVIEPDELPEWARVEKIVFKPDLDAIKEAFAEDQAGFSCPGVVITNAQPVLTVRTR